MGGRNPVAAPKSPDYRAPMVLQLEAVTFEVADAAAVAAFWAGLLQRDIFEVAGGVLVPGHSTQVGLRFVTSDTRQIGPRRLHLHVTSTSLEDQQRTVESALRLGGRHIDVGQGPDDDFVVLADPGGNELCVIEPHNTLLAGTGHLGEVTCDGTRDVGLFWRDVLDWALVWDQLEETAVQSPLGGTKVSWGGPPVEPQTRAEPAAIGSGHGRPQQGGGPARSTGRDSIDRSRRRRRTRGPRRQRVRPSRTLKARTQTSKWCTQGGRLEGA